MKSVLLRHHLAGLGSALALFGVIALGARQVAPSQDRSIEITKFGDSLSDGADVAVVNSNILDVSRVAATRALSKSARIGFIYTSESVCASIHNNENPLAAMEVNSVTEFAPPTYLVQGAAELGKTQSIVVACFDSPKRSRLVFTGSRELKKELLTNGVAPSYITVSGLK